MQGDFREQIGWRELVQEVAKIRDSLTPEERAHLGIIGTNYGEAGAINLYGPEYGLPRAISGVNSFWYRGYGDPPPQTVIVIGLSRKYMDDSFESCRLAGHTWNLYGVKNEETVDHPDIYVCGPPKKRLARILEGLPLLRLASPTQENRSLSLTSPANGRILRP